MSPVSALIARLTSLPRRSKQAVMAAIDVFLCVASTWLAFSFRFEEFFVPWMATQVAIFALAPLLSLPIFIRIGLYRAVFRYSGVGATAAVARAMTIYAIAFGTIVIATSLPEVPRSVSIIQPLIYAWAVLAVRSFGGHLFTRGSMLKGRNREKLLIYGAGVSGIQTMNALQASLGYEVVGFIDDNPEKIGREIVGLTVHDRRYVADLISNRDVESVLLAMPKIGRARRNAIIEWLRDYSVRVLSVPSVLQIASGKVTLNNVLELDIEDLLGRDPVEMTIGAVSRNLEGRTVMVTGAGGSIGSELCRQIVRAGPTQLLLVESSEFALYDIHRELQALCSGNEPPIRIVPFLANVRDLERMTEICKTWRPTTVYHAAAYKHVPLVEHNPAEGVANNVIGTLHTAQAAVLGGAERFVLVSTDKAVRPSNIMGASKRLAEIVLQALAAEKSITFSAAQIPHRNRTIFTMVRFGNVLGSSGSVVPIFRSQLAAGGPLTVTHREVTRYFMTIPEAAQLVLQAGAMAEGGEVFLLDMGEPVRIFDLARRIIELSGATVKDETNPDGDIAIEFTGLRPGEKLYEELLIGDNPLGTPHPRIMQARERMWPWKQIRARLDRLEQALASNDVPAIRAILAELVDGFNSDGEVVDWIQLERETALSSELGVG
ncbi:MAG: polysaccharide biosynthesis protein [Sphingosinicella sp.]